jgi:hypothetical protein
VSRFIQIVKTEPALLTGAVQVALALLSATVVSLTAGQTGAILAVTTAVLALNAAIATRPFQVQALAGFATAAVTLLITFGVPHVDPGIVATANAAIVAIAPLIVRSHVTPVATLKAEAAWQQPKPAPAPAPPPPAAPAA